MKSIPSRDISLWIDEYDDIFSDFDPRSYADRNISDDFIYELKRLCRESEFYIGELRLQVPEKLRKEKEESVIVKSLQQYFKKNLLLFSQKLKTEKRKGLLMILIAVFSMTIGSYLLSIQSTHFLIHTLLVIFESSGWFLLWAGFENIISTHRKELPEFEFFKKLSKSAIRFISIKK